MSTEHPDEHDDVEDSTPHGSSGQPPDPEGPGDGTDPGGPAGSGSTDPGDAGSSSGSPDDVEDPFGGPSFEDDELFTEELDEHELHHIRRDLDDLADFESAFRPEGYRGVAVWCHDCAEEHFYPWDMLRENLQVLLETGETPVHEPAFAPEPERYVPWDYARGYVDALRDSGVDQRLDLGSCPRCRLELHGEAAQANYCPRCATPLLLGRLAEALEARGLDDATIQTILRQAGFPG